MSLTIGHLYKVLPVKQVNELTKQAIEYVMINTTAIAGEIIDK